MSVCAMESQMVPSDALLWRAAFYRDFGRRIPPEIYIQNG